MDQQQLAHAAGVSRQTIVELEGGGYNPSTALALRLALLLDVAVEELFSLTREDATALQAHTPDEAQLTSCWRGRR